MKKKAKVVFEIDIPNSCSECSFEHDCRCEICRWIRTSSEKYLKVRHKDCPIEREINEVERGDEI